LSYFDKTRKNKRFGAEEADRTLEKIINDMPVLPPVIVDVPTSYSYHTKMLDVNAPINNTFSGKLLKYMELTAINSAHQLRLQREMERINRRIERVLVSQNPKGQTFPMSISLTAANGLIQVNFKDPEQSQDIPAGTSIIYPQELLYQLIIVNIGPNDIRFSTNVTSNSSEASTPLVARSQMDLKFEIPTIKTVNLLCPSGSANLTLIGII